MSDEQVVQPITFDPMKWCYSLHVVRYGAPVSNVWWLEHCKWRGAEGERRWQDPDIPSLHHLELRWPVREARELRHGSLNRLCVVWGMVHGQRLTEAVRDAAQEHKAELGQYPIYGYTRRLPSGIDEPVDIEIGEGIEPVTLFLASWVPEKFIVLFR